MAFQDRQVCPVRTPACETTSDSGSDYGPHEDSPLLDPRPTTSSGTTLSSSDSAAEHVLSLEALARLAPYYCIAALVEAGSTLYRIPMYEILEEIICAESRPSSLGSTPPEDCGRDSMVQGEIAVIRGWQATMSLIPG